MELVVVETMADRLVDVPLERISGTGVFVKEVQAAVVRGVADAAVHSAKDLPSAPELAVPGLMLVAVPERADPRDLLVGGTLRGLATGTAVATGSARRRAQLANLRPDLTFSGLRGNLARRLAAVGNGPAGAVVVAKAAVDRLGWRPPPNLVTEVLEPETMVPQVGQGTIAVECREDDDGIRAALAAIDDPISAPLLAAERSFLVGIGGGCSLPVGAWARTGAVGSEEVVLTGMVAAADGVAVLRHEGTGCDPVALGAAVARSLLEDDGATGLGGWSPVGGSHSSPHSTSPESTSA